MNLLSVAGNVTRLWKWEWWSCAIVQVRISRHRWADKLACFHLNLIITLYWSSLECVVKINRSDPYNTANLSYPPPLTPRTTCLCCVSPVNGRFLVINGSKLELSDAFISIDDYNPSALTRDICVLRCVLQLDFWVLGVCWWLALPLCDTPWIYKYFWCYPLAKVKTKFLCS